MRGSEGTEAPEELLKGHPDQGGMVAHRPGEAEWFGHSSALSSTLAGGGWGAWEGRIGRGRWCPPLPRSPQREPALFKNRVSVSQYRGKRRGVRYCNKRVDIFAPTRRHTDTQRRATCSGLSARRELGLSVALSGRCRYKPRWHRPDWGWPRLSFAARAPMQAELHGGGSSGGDVGTSPSAAAAGPPPLVTREGRAVGGRHLPAAAAAECAPGRRAGGLAGLR